MQKKSAYYQDNYYSPRVLNRNSYQRQQNIYQLEQTRRYRKKHQSDNSLKTYQYQLSKMIPSSDLPSIIILNKLNNQWKRQQEVVTATLKKQVYKLKKQISSILEDKRIKQKVSKEILKMNLILNFNPFYKSPSNAMSYPQYNQNLCEYHRFKSQGNNNFDPNLNRYYHKCQNQQNQENQRNRICKKPKKQILKKFKKVGLVIFFITLLPAVSHKIKQLKFAQLNIFGTQDQQYQQYETKLLQIKKHLFNISLDSIYRSYNPNKGRISAFQLIDSYKSIKLINNNNNNNKIVNQLKQSRNSLKNIKSQSLALVLHFTQGILGQFYLKMTQIQFLNKHLFILLFNHFKGIPYFDKYLTSQQDRILNQNEKNEIDIDTQTQKTLLSIFIFGKILILNFLNIIHGMQKLQPKQRIRISQLGQDQNSRFFEVVQISTAFISIIIEQLIQQQYIRRKILIQKINIFNQVNRLNQVKQLIKNRYTIIQSKQQVKGFIKLICGQIYDQIQILRSQNNIRCKKNAIQSKYLVQNYQIHNKKRRTILRKNTKQKSIKKHNVNLSRRISKISKRSLQQHFGSFR